MPRDPVHKIAEVDLSVQRLCKLKQNVMDAPGYGKDFPDSAPYMVFTDAGYHARFSNLAAAAATLIELGRGIEDRSRFFVTHEPTERLWDFAACMSEKGRRWVA